MRDVLGMPFLGEGGEDGVSGGMGCHRACDGGGKGKWWWWVVRCGMGVGGVRVGGDGGRESGRRNKGSLCSCFYYCERGGVFVLCFMIFYEFDV